MTYVNGFLLAVPETSKEQYVDSARKSWPLFKEYGALSMLEAWEDNVPDGEHTSFPMAVKRKPGEKVVFSWVVWPDKATAEAGVSSMEADPRWNEIMDMDNMPFDGKRMMWGGFTAVFQG